MPDLCGPVVQSVETLSAPPAPKGGPLPGGLYFLKNVNIYRTTANGSKPTFQYTREFSPTQFAALSYVNGMEESPTSGTFSGSGTNLTFVITCPTSVQRTVGYTSDATSLTLYETMPGSSDVYEFVYAKQ